MGGLDFPPRAARRPPPAVATMVAPPGWRRSSIVPRSATPRQGGLTRVLQDGLSASHLRRQGVGSPLRRGAMRGAHGNPDRTLEFWLSIADGNEALVGDSSDDARGETTGRSTASTCSGFVAL